MSKTISWPARVTYIFIALALALSLAGMTAVSADPAKESEWDDVSTPSGDGLVITPGLDILDFDMGPDGETIYAVVEVEPGWSCEIDSDEYEAGDTILLKSEDSGATWSDITDELPTEFTGDLILVSVAPDNADFVVVATDTEVYGSNEGGDDFYDTDFSIASDEATISCLDVSPESDDDEWNIAVGTDEGGIWRFVSGGYWRGQWKAAMPEEPVAAEDGVWYVSPSGTSDYLEGATGGNTPATAFGTIEDAIKQAEDDGMEEGSTIYVLPGDYTPDATLDISEAGLTLKSTDGPEETIIAPTDATAISITGIGVTVEGFTMENTTTIMTISGADVTVKNNILTAETVATPVMGISLTGTGATISGNRLDINSTMYVSGGVSGCTLSGNFFGAGINLMGGNKESIDILNNTIIGSEYEGINFQTGNTYTDILIEGNTISETTLGDAVGIYVRGTINTLVITGNAITDNGVGIRIEEGVTWDTDNTINNNNISGNAWYGVENLGATLVDAENNWWGSVNGPQDLPSTVEEGIDVPPCTATPEKECNQLPVGELGDAVVDDATYVVDYCPWLLAAVTVAPTEIPPYDTVPTEAAGDYAGWVESNKVTSVAFSPNFDGDETILAVTTVGAVTYLQSGRWDTKEWNEEASPLNVKAVQIVDGVDGVAESSGIAIPSDYDGFTTALRKVFVYVNTVGNGYLFRIDSYKLFVCPAGEESAFGPDDNPLFASLAYYGAGIDGKFMLGTKDATKVWHAEDMNFCCPEWSGASKAPTGSDALVAFTPDGKKGYAATSGVESAFSISLDDGACWNQLSLIDTNIDRLSDVAVNPDCGTTLLFSVNDGGGCDSVWFKADDLEEASEYNGVWLREWCDDLEGSPEIGLIRLAPEETERVFTVYLVDRGTDKVWHNDSSGLTKWIDRHCTRISDITDLAVESESIIYALGGKDVSKSTDNGRKWSSTVDSKVDKGHTIAVLGDYVLVGGEDAEVSYSDDAGDSFTALDKAGEGLVHVAFDSYFGDNGVVYAASDSIYRCSDLEEGEWTNFKSVNGPYYGIVLDNAAGNPMTDEDTGGVLYAVYEDGMARVLGAADSKDEDYLVNGAPDEGAFIAEPGALKICGCLTEDSNTLLWAINLAVAYDLEEGKNNLFVYEDCLSKAGVELSKVEDEAVIAADPCYCQNDKFILNWDDLYNSSTYELEIALDEDFDFLVEDYEPATVDDEHKLVAKGDLDCNETYYWRVRVIKADSDAETIRSWWSDGWSFTVQAGPAGAIQLTAPDAGVADVAIEGVAFTWTSVAAATSYDFALMDSAGSVVSSETGLTGTAYAYPGKLSYDATYTWKVTAMKDGSVLSESSLSTFRTVTAAVFTCPQCGLSFPSDAALKDHIAEVHAPVEPTTPSWVWVVIGLGAVLVITILVLIFRTRRI